MLLLLLACAPPSSAPDAEARELLVAHLDGGEVLRFHSDGTPDAPLLGLDAVADIEATTGRAFAPSAVTPLDDGGAWVSDFVTGVVVEVDDLGGFVRVVRNQGSGAGLLQEPCAMARQGDRVAVLGNDSGNVVFVDAEDDAVLGVPVPLRYAHGLEWVGDTIWVGRSATEPSSGQVERFDLVSGERTGEMATFDDVTEATAVRLDGDRLLVADFFRGRITAWDPWSGDALGVVASGLEGPIDVEVDDAGILWVLDREGVVRVDPLGGEAERVVHAADHDLGWTRDLVVR